MTLKAITFLGYTPPDRPYREATYRFDGQECTTPFMAEATARFFAPNLDTLLVLVTREAEAQNLAALRARLPEPERLLPVPIPSGLSAEELWTMFSAIEGQIAPGDRIIFDITNGFRSLPVLAFLAASFVRVVRGAHVERMIYGAFDATRDGVTPVFDLTPFLTLLDWTTATDAFLKYGRADDLAALARTGDDSPLDTLAASVGTLTAGLQTSRPAEVQREADALGARIDAARAAATSAPFDLLLDRIRAEYTPLGHPDPLDRLAAWEVLAGQAEIVTWCVRKGLYVQAITNAREWIVSLVVAAAGGDIFDNDRDRALAENAINRPRNTTAPLWNDTLKRKEEVTIPPAMRQAAQNRTLRELWNATRDLRNDLSHTGMRRIPPPRPAAQVVAEVRAACALIPALLAELAPRTPGSG